MKHNRQWIKRVGVSLLALSFPLSSYAITLQEAVEDALIHSPDFREQLKSAQALQADLRAAKGGYYPKVDLAGGIGYEEVKRPNIDNTGDGLTRREASIKVSQNLFEGFGTQYEVERVQAKLDAQLYKVQDQANQVALDMIKAYIKLMQEEKLLKLSRDNVDTHRRILDQIIQRQKAGVGDKVEVDQARARLYLAESNLAADENNFNDAKARFHRVLGRKPEHILVRPKFTYALPKSLKEAVDQALEHYPTLLSANADIVQTLSSLKRSKRYYYPRVDLELQKTFDRDISGIKGPNEDLQVMLRVKYNLYNGGQDQAGVSNAVATFERAAEIRNKTRRQTIENIRYAWNAVVSIKTQIDYQTRHIKMTHDTLLGYRKQFSLGRRSLLDLLNTEDEYNNSMRTLVKAQSDYLTAQYRILHGMGKLLPALKIDLALIQVDHSYDKY